MNECRPLGEYIDIQVDTSNTTTPVTLIAWNDDRKAIGLSLEETLLLLDILKKIEVTIIEEMLKG